jgi:hypothetical protein
MMTSCDLQNKFLLVTEHLPSIEGFTENFDKPAGPNIRTSMNSGIELYKEPFNSPKTTQVILEINEATGGQEKP